MGMFKDMRDLTKAGKQMQKERGGSFQMMKDGLPFPVKRKFSAGRLGRIEQGRQLDVVYDPMNPEKVELA